MEADQMAAAFYKEESFPVTGSINAIDTSNILIITYSKLIAQVNFDIIKKQGITILDITNILYLCQDNPDYLNEFIELLYFPITDIIHLNHMVGLLSV